MRCKRPRKRRNQVSDPGDQDHQRLARGGGVDLSARIIADQLQKLWGQPVTVENRTGGSNNIAGEAVAKAEPDGYTLLATPPNTLTANAVLFKQLNYDPAALEPVAIMAIAPNVLAVKDGSPAKTVADLIALAKANPGKLSYASQGNGSTTHLTSELFASRTGIKLVHVPYRGAAPAVNDLAGGHVDTMFCDLGTILPLHQGGRVRIIATATLDRLSQIPPMPTIDESGVKGFSSSTFFSLMAPPRTPAGDPHQTEQGDRRRHADAGGAGKAQDDLRRSEQARYQGDGRVRQGRGQALGRRDPRRQHHRGAVGDNAKSVSCGRDRSPFSASARYLATIT